MTAIDAADLVSHLVPPLDQQLAEQLLAEFVSLERRYVLHDWEPATLDGGQFAEITARILFHQDSGRLDKRRGVSACVDYVEDPSQNHAYPDSKSARHQVRVLRVIYKFRSDRGAVHIDENYSANQLDSRLLMEGARWLVSETLRIFWNSDRQSVAKVLRQIARFEVPAIGRFEDRVLVQRTDLQTDEEILLLLYNAGEEGLSRTELGKFVLRAPSTVTETLKKLTSAGHREVVRLPGSRYRLSDLGMRRVFLRLGDRVA